jgi:hypothetical protein
MQPPLLEHRGGAKKLGDSQQELGFDSPNCSSTSSLELVAELHAPQLKPGRPFSDRYSLTFHGREIASGRNAELDGARWLSAHGFRGWVFIVDGRTRKPRLFLDIERAARLTVIENRTTGPRFARWVPFKAFLRDDGRVPSPERVKA